jgi:hypothetical protein
MKLDNFTFYENLDDLPIKNYNLLQKYALIDLGIGSDLSDVVRHHVRFNQLLEVKDYDSLYIENENLMINYNFLLSSKNIKGYVLASLLKEVDGVKVHVTDDTIESYVDMLEASTITFGELESYTTDLKKKLTLF